MRGDLCRNDTKPFEEFCHFKLKLTRIKICSPIRSRLLGYFRLWLKDGLCSNPVVGHYIEHSYTEVCF